MRAVTPAQETTPNAAGPQWELVRPGNTANPHIGSAGMLEEVPEVRVETLCLGEEVARKAVQALKM